MRGLPEPKKRRFYHSNKLLEGLNLPSAVAAGVPAIVLVIQRVFYPSAETSRSDVALAVIGSIGAVMVILIAVVKLAQGWDKDAEESELAKHHDLRAAMHLIHGFVRHQQGFHRRDKNKLRVTIHRVIRPKKKGESPEYIEQMVNYVGGQEDGAERRFSIRSGITGKAIREKVTLVASRNNDDIEAYIQEMISEWSFTEEDARKLTLTRNSFMAVPIKYKGEEVTGVVYLDSNDKDFFTPEVQNQVISACGGLATFLDERY